MKLQELYEEKEVNLIGKTVNHDALITVNTQNQVWEHYKFECTNLNLTSLIGSPKETTGSYDCSSNKIKTLIGAPKKIGKLFACDTNPELISLEGAPEIIGGKFYAFDCAKLVSLKDIHKFIKHINQEIIINNCPIKSHVLGLLKIQGLKKVQMSLNYTVENILNKYLQEPYGNKRIIDCQSELIDAGLDEFAQL